jgi:hypothetical protein
MIGGPIASQQEAEETQALIEAAEKEYPDEADRSETMQSLIASSKKKLADWQAHNNADDSLR